MSQYELNLHDYWRIIRRRKYVILLTFLFVVVSTGIYTSLQQPVYETSATMRVEPESNVGREFGLNYVDYDMYSEMQTYIRIINSPVIYKKIAANLGLIDNIKDQNEIDMISSRIGSKIDARRIREANLIQIFGISVDPREAALVANEAVKAFLEYNVEIRIEQSKHVKDFIATQLAQAEEKLKRSEELRKTFIEKNEATGMAGQLSSKLLALQEQKDILLKKYTVNHPEVKKINSQIYLAENQLKKLPASDTELARLTRDVKINEDSYLLLKRKYKDAEISEADRTNAITVLSRAVVPLTPARPNKQLNMLIGIVMGILLGIIFALIIENLDTSIGTIEDVESYLKLPVLGVVPHIEKEKDAMMFAESNKKGKTQRIEHLYQSLIFFHAMRSPIVEAYHTLRTNIKLQDTPGNGVTMLFTSAGVGEGKSINSVNYAISASMVGIKTLLIDLDLRRPTINRIFGLPKEMGITNVLQGNTGWQDVIKGTSDFMLGRLGIDNVLKAQGLENLKIFTCGTIPSNPADILHSQELPKLLAKLKKEFQLIIIDTPPVLLFADSMIVANKVDATILIYQVGKMARSALNRAKIQLENVKANIKGVVLNDIHASEMESRYGYYYYSSYKDYAKPR